MNILPEHIKIDKGRLQSLLKQGTIDTKVYNMLTEDKTEYEEIDDPWSRLGPKKKSKGVKKRKVDVPLADDSVPQEPMDTNDVPKAEPNEGWDVVPSPPSQPPQDEGEDIQSAEDETEREQKSNEDKQVDAAGWAFTWCFRCKREDIWKFGGKTLPGWLVSTLNFKGDIGAPIVLSICCIGCNNKHRSATVSIPEEEKRMRQAFEVLRVDCDSVGEESLRVAKARIGREVHMIQWGGRAGSVDVEMMKKNSSPKDIVVSLCLEAYREGKKGSELELGGVAGGLF
jgi:hypothetical protein